MLTGGSELPLLVIKTGKNEEKVSTCSRRLYRKNSIPHSSVEVYYGGASGSVAIPFGWESQPGTPKVGFRETPLPPLTPPPSYLVNSPQTLVRKNSKLKASLLYSLLPKLMTRGRKSNSPESPASSPSSYSSSSSSPYSQDRGGEIQFSSARSSFESRRQKDDEFSSKIILPKEDELESPVSTLCFGIRRGTNSQSRGCSPRLIKSVLFPRDRGSLHCSKYVDPEIFE